MRGIKLTPESFAMRTLVLGRVGENAATTIFIDLSGIHRDYPNASASIVVKQPNGREYPAVTTQSGSILMWVVSRADLGDKAGDGYAQITIRATDGTVVKTAIAKTSVGASIGDATEPAPEPVKTWIDSATAALGKVIQSGADAAEAAKNAEAATEACIVATEKSIEATSEATAAAIDAKKAAELAGQLANKNGFFYVEGRSDGKLYLITSDTAPADFTLKDNGEGVLIAVYG